MPRSVRALNGFCGWGATCEQGHIPLSGANADLAMTLASEHEAETRHATVAKVISNVSGTCECNITTAAAAASLAD